MNICMCGAQAGYLHDITCPYPLYHNGHQQTKEWQIAHDRKKYSLEKGETMEWTYFDLIKVNAGYYLFDIEYKIPIEENDKIKVFSSYDDAEDYLTKNDIRGSIRNIVKE